MHFHQPKYLNASVIRVSKSDPLLECNRDCNEQTKLYKTVHIVHASCSEKQTLEFGCEFRLVHAYLRKKKKLWNWLLFAYVTMMIWLDGVDVKNLNIWLSNSLSKWLEQLVNSETEP